MVIDSAKKFYIVDSSSRACQRKKRYKINRIPSDFNEPRRAKNMSASLREGSRATMMPNGSILAEFLGRLVVPRTSHRRQMLLEDISKAFCQV